jgi:hypothetical protein
LDLVAVPGNHDGLRIVEDTNEGNASEDVEGAEEAADESLHLLVGDDLAVDPSRPLEAAREEVEDLRWRVVVADPHVTKVILAELAGEALETDHRGGDDLAKTTGQLVDGVLATDVALLTEATENLHCREITVFGEDLPCGLLEGDCHRRATYRRSRRRIDVPLIDDALDGPKAHARLPGDLSKGQICSAKYENLVAFHSVVHEGPSREYAGGREGVHRGHGESPPETVDEVGKVAEFREDLGSEYREPTPSRW